MTDRQTITVTALEISPYDFEGTLVDMRNKIRDWIDQYGPCARVNWNPDNWPQYNDSPSPQFEIQVFREETDAEWTKRINTNETLAKMKAERDLAEYNRLKKLFGDK
jgi:hypothetical protein